MSALPRFLPDSNDISTIIPKVYENFWHFFPDANDIGASNQEAYEDLVVSIEANQHKFNLLIAICDDSQLRDRLIARYEKELGSHINSVRLILARNQLSLKSAVKHLIENNHILQQSKEGVITVTGIEKLALSSVDQAPSEMETFMGYLQWTRENFLDFPYSIILWITPIIAQNLEKKAPDFWAWRKGVFRFVGGGKEEVATDNTGSTSLNQLSDSNLIALCQEGRYPNRPAFTELLRRHQSHVDRILYHLAPDWQDRADLAQKVWIRVYRNIKRLSEPLYFRVWLSRIATNLFYDELRKRKRINHHISLDAPRRVNDGEIDWEIMSSYPSPEDALATHEFYDSFQTAIADLPEAFRTAIILGEIEGKTFEEIAEITGVSVGTVKSRIARAKAKLQSVLQPYFDQHKIE